MIQVVSISEERQWIATYLGNDLRGRKQDYRRVMKLDTRVVGIRWLKYNMELKVFIHNQEFLNPTEIYRLYQK